MLRIWNVCWEMTWKMKPFDELACDLVLEEKRLRFKMYAFYSLSDTFWSQLEKWFKDFTTFAHKFKVVDQIFFVQKYFNECEEVLSELADMHESDTENLEDLILEFKSFCQLYKEMLKDAVISEVHKICDVLHFIEICEMRRIFIMYANLYNCHSTVACQVH